jgi:hypothetical protein
MSANSQQLQAYWTMLTANFARQIAMATEQAADAARALTKELREQNELLEERKQLREEEELGF